jgi:hypothetical protein
MLASQKPARYHSPAATGLPQGVRMHAAQDTPPVFYLWSARLSKSGSDLTYSDLPWNAHRSAHMSLSARGIYLPHWVALVFVDGFAIAVI